MPTGRPFENPFDAAPREVLEELETRSIATIMGAIDVKQIRLQDLPEVSAGFLGQAEDGYRINVNRSLRSREMKKFVTESFAKLVLMGSCELETAADVENMVRRAPALANTILERHAEELDALIADLRESGSVDIAD